MKKDTLSEFLGDKKFIDFALEHNELGDTDELGILLEVLKKSPDNKTLEYIYSVQEFTETLLDTLKNYTSKTMFLRILSTLPKNIVQYKLGDIQVYDNPSRFNAVFHHNYLYGLQSLANLGIDRQTILSYRNNFGKDYYLGIEPFIDTQTGVLIVQMKIGFLEKDKNDGYFFHNHRTIHEKKFSLKATSEYIAYKYPNTNFFDLLKVPFDDVLMAKNG